MSDVGIQYRNGGGNFCLVCGESVSNGKLSCPWCGVNNNVVDTLVENGSDVFVWVGGSGYGVNGVYSTTFHALNENRTESVCGRLEVDVDGGVESGLSWGTPVFTLEATSNWQSEPCGHCERSGGFDQIKRSVDSVLRLKPFSGNSDGL